jgi:hypothetical protein
MHPAPRGVVRAIAAQQPRAVVDAAISAVAEGVDFSYNTRPPSHEVDARNGKEQTGADRKSEKCEGSSEGQTRRCEGKEGARQGRRDAEASRRACEKNATESRREQTGSQACQNGREARARQIRTAAETGARNEKARCCVEASGEAQSSRNAVREVSEHDQIRCFHRRTDQGTEGTRRRSCR